MERFVRENRRRRSRQRRRLSFNPRFRDDPMCAGSTRTARREQEEQREDRGFIARDALLALVTVVPGEGEYDREPDNQRDGCELLRKFRQWKVSEKKPIT